MNSHENYIWIANILQTLIKRGVIQTRLPWISGLEGMLDSKSFKCIAEKNQDWDNHSPITSYLEAIVENSL